MLSMQETLHMHLQHQCYFFPKYFSAQGYLPILWFPPLQSISGPIPSYWRTFPWIIPIPPLRTFLKYLPSYVTKSLRAEPFKGVLPLMNYKELKYWDIKRVYLGCRWVYLGFWYPRSSRFTGKPSEMKRSRRVHKSRYQKIYPNPKTHNTKKYIETKHWLRAHLPHHPARATACRLTPVRQPNQCWVNFVTYGSVA